MDFLLLLIELFSLDVTAEALRAKIDRKSVISLRRGHWRFSHKETCSKLSSSEVRFFVVTLLTPKAKSCHGRLKCAILGFSLRRPALLNVHWIMPNGPSIVLLILSLGQLVDWHQMRYQIQIKYSC